MNGRLAIEGGAKAVSPGLPTFLNSAGRTFGEEEERLVIEALRSGCLSRNGGTMVTRLESAFAGELGAGEAVACSSGTAAVHLAVAALDLDPGDEIVVPPITDIGSLLPILWQNAVPVFADVDERTLCLDPASADAAISPRTRAIMAVHLAGQPCAMDELLALARRRGLPLIEDCSQAYFAESSGRLVGTMGDLACFSLQQSKHMTSGEGGLTVSRHEPYLRRARLFSDKAWPRDSKSLGACRFLFLAQNYRMSELQGAVALAQLGKVRAAVERRRASAARFTEAIAGLEGVTAPQPPEGTLPSWWLYMLRIDREAAGADAGTFGAALAAEGVPCWPRYIIDPLYRSPIFAEQATYGRSGEPLRAHGRQSYAKGLCPAAERALENVVAVWWNENYGDRHIEELAAATAKVARHYARAGAVR